MNDIFDGTQYADYRTEEQKAIERYRWTKEARRDARQKQNPGEGLPLFDETINAQEELF